MMFVALTSGRNTSDANTEGNTAHPAVYRKPYP